MLSLSRERVARGRAAHNGRSDRELIERSCSRESEGLKKGKTSVVKKRKGSGKA